MKKILVANRGEIAIRVMKTLKKMGIKCCAIHSDADFNAPFVSFADESYHLPGNSSSQTYLNQDQILKICIENGIDAVHPGYGFLSENYQFAQKLRDNGIAFIGPDIHALKIMGDKLLAKEAVLDYGIPLMPGSKGAVLSFEDAAKQADEIGYPILIKAAAGGGGKGMRIVEKPQDLKQELKLAISEAISAFSSGEVFIEKYISSPRHIEFQILGDRHGNFVHLFERECSIQRRHQKVIEEAPSVLLSEDLREKMGKAAVDVARACSYVGAGTIEFLMDESHNFYFMEMNTRLQVEHPVTEWISGIDLVEQQILIEMGLPLSFEQKDLKIKGHSIELRVYAEDPENDFMPDIGILTNYSEPKGEFVRVDSGYTQGMRIPIHYDPMISKLITYGQTRQEAIENMIQACNNYCIFGVKTTISFGRYVMQNQYFVNGDFDTNFIKKHFSSQKLTESFSKEEKMGLIFANYLKDKGSDLHTQKPSKNNWKQNRLN